MSMDKTVVSAKVAVADILDGASIAVGGFGLSGNPMVLINAILESGAKDLSVVSNNCGVDDWGLGVLLKAHRIRKMTSSYVGENKEFERQFLSGELELDLTPQGTLAEKLRAGGSGIAAFFTTTGVGTQVAEGGLPRRGDTHGNLVFNKSARNFNPIAAMAGRICIAEVEELVQPGEIDPDSVHLPGVYVHRVLEVGTDVEKRIERRTVREA